MNVKQFGVPVVVAVNRFTSDTRRRVEDGGRCRAVVPACAWR